MNRIFLSHSSKDKDFVRPIAKYFGADRCVYDEMTFEIGTKTIDEIFKSINHTDIFVYFISDSSLNSTWVQDEINQAEGKLNDNTHKLSQIYPIIIDDTVSYKDSRIPQFLKSGKTAYNLRHVDNPKLACKKIESQIMLLNMQRDLDFSDRVDFFYGRDLEKKAFKDSFEQRTIEGKTKHVKCLVVSGIDGIGRKSYIRGVLKDSGLMERHYFPMMVSLEKSEAIEDLIIKISDLGFGCYTIPDISNITSLDEKIDLLISLLIKAQNYSEHIIIEDHLLLITVTSLRETYT